MKLSRPRPPRNKPRIYHTVAEKLTPVVTLNEQLQRVKEWTQKFHSEPSPKKEKRPVNTANTLALLEDIEPDPLSQSEFSELVVEGVQLLDNREHQTVVIPLSPSPSPKEEQHDKPIPHPDIKSDSNFDDHGVKQIGKEFLKAKLSPKPYVKEFEAKINEKKIIESAIFKTYPYRKPKGGSKGKKLFPTASKIIPMRTTHQIPLPVGEQDSWRHNTSRSIPFKTKYSTELIAGSSSAKQAERVPGSERAQKQENDRDWWKWKLKQRFLENDELLQKLVDQRQKLEAILLKPGEISLKDIGKVAPVSSAASSVTPFSRNPSRHVTVEFTKGQAKHSELVVTRMMAPKSTKPSGKSIRDPIPNFYAPSKQIIRSLMSTSPQPSAASRLYPPKSEVNKKQKLKTLKEDPYLSKILAGNEIFKPEIMLEANQPTTPITELSHHHHHHAVREQGNLRRKMSLESLSDSSDDDVRAAEFFNPDVKVLYERLPDMMLSAQKESSRKLYIAL